MSSRDREIKSLQDKLKVFFKKGGSAALPARSELVVTAEMARELGRDSPAPRRIRALRDLSERVHTVRITEPVAQKLWGLIHDMLEDPTVECRHTAITFLHKVVEATQSEAAAEDLSLMRSVFLRYLRESHPNHPPEDEHLRFKLLHSLTNTGKNIKCYEEQIGAFLLEWLPQVQDPALTEEFLQLVINVVKFNATYLDEDIVNAFVSHACELAVFAEEPGVVLVSLALLEAVVGYSMLPRDGLRALVAALCRCVNLERYCQPAWKLMRIVLGADAGHAALAELARLLAEEANAGLQRGAVFCVHRALWGPSRVPGLQVALHSVLPALLKAVERKQSVVTYEVTLALQSLVSRAAAELQQPAWDLVLAAVRAVVDQDREAAASQDPRSELLHSRLHALISSLEQLHDAGQYCGNEDSLLALLDYCGHERPEASTIRLVSLLAGRLAMAERDWVASALALAERYIRHEPRRRVRTHTLQQIASFVTRHRTLFGEELLELVGLPVLSACATDPDCALRAAAASALVELARQSTSDAVTDLIDLLEKILNRPFDIFVLDVPVPAGEAEAADIHLAAAGLIQLFYDKMYSSPASHAARCLLVLLDHLEQHYKKPAMLQHHPSIRVKIFELLYTLRANALCCVGVCWDGSGAPVWGAAAARLRPVCAAALLVEPAARRGQPPAAREPAPGAALLPASRCARALGLALTAERDWPVQCGVLRALPALLHARAPAVGRRAPDVDLLAGTLCALVAERSAAPQQRRPLTSEVHGAALPALAALAPYHKYLEPPTQKRVVRCLLKFGMRLRAAQPFLDAQPYIYALTVFTLETRDTMIKMLPEVLLDLSKISDTKAIASPMLEFLSTLTRLPAVFASFVEDQYMSVFAILLPYTNPSRYNHYVVSLAHHVIAAWFLKCRLSYRRNFVQFIIHGLHNYVIVPFEEQLQNRSNKSLRQAANEDSSNRQRSSSLGSRAVPRAPLSVSGGASAAFHVELTETCVDLLTRYTSSRVSCKPQRLDIADFLFAGGQSMTWVVGHKVVTITTAGCLQNSPQAGPCERCAALCRDQQDSFDSAQAQSSETESSGNNQLQVGNPPEVKRQNSSENKQSDSVAETFAKFAQQFEKRCKEIDTEEPVSRAAALAAAGACPCWSANWAELHVRTPTGDVSWLVRGQNQETFEQLMEWGLLDVAAMLQPATGAATATHDQTSESPPRSRSGSGSTQGRSQDLHKSSSDSVVSGERRPPLAASHCIVPPHPVRSSTQPINIPSSPQRQSSSSTTDDDDLLLIVPEGKSRHPVRRSNSSPEMSSSWKLARDSPELDDDILLPSCEPAGTMSMALHASKKAAKKSDMRVSCEAIPEEMGTSPLAAGRTQPDAHPHLMTYKSDPGAEPTQSSTQTHHQLQKTASDSTVPSSSKPPRSPASSAAAGVSSATAGASSAAASTSSAAAPNAAAGGSAAAAGDGDDLPPLSRSRRSHTISVMSPTRRHREKLSRGAAAGAAGGADAGLGLGGAGLTPSFFFLQLYHNLKATPLTGAVPGEPPPRAHPLLERPLRVLGVQHERTIKNLDLVPPVDTYKVGVLYVARGQHDNETAILRNAHGSVRYAALVAALGAVVPLALGAPEPDLFLTMERGGRDGSHTYVWRDDVMQMLFHVATLMPTSPKDPNCNEKRKYIGNDLVSIVYNDSGEEFDIQTIKGQANLCVVVVEPLEHAMNRVVVLSKEARVREFLPHLHTYHVSDAVAARLARQLALHCSLAAQVAQSLRLNAPPFASNALERLRLIKRLRARLEAEREAAVARPHAMSYSSPDQAQRIAIDDFNDYA
ncbi:tuberin [Amyelois transitella]|uniref:tuberin n=1 Tax=Amyelois transitella TaxID=680683 RepID=UPI00298FB0C8|nr:tuberin [Amyelois transitella]